MKRTLVVLMLIGLLSPMTFAGGIVTNANQSAAYIRMPAQDATLGIDAVYYNPAGIAFMQDGFYVSLNNQYIVQNRTITSTFPGMNQTKFEGGVLAPLFPSVYLVYKKDRVAYSFGLTPIGGGGSATFDKGLPSFEQQVAVIPSALTANGLTTTQYSMESEFEGRSLIWGLQMNGTYKINDMIAVSLGVRYLIAKNSYVGNLKNIQIDPDLPANFPAAMQTAYDGSMVSAPTFFSDMAAYFTGVSTQLTNTATSLNPIITGGGGSILLSNGTAVGLTPTQVATLQATITSLGGDPSTMTILDAQTYFSTQATGFTGRATTMTGYAAGTRDKKVDVEQNGIGVSPIIGIDVKVSDQLNIGFRYEHRAKMKVENSTKVDNTNLYPNGGKTPFDMPSTISLGASYKPMEKLLISGGFHYYLDKGADYGKKIEGAFVDNSKVIDKNFWEGAIGVEYMINDKFLVSAGYLRTQTGVKSNYQSDLSHSLSTNTIGAGCKYNLNEKIGINLGFMYSQYIENTRDFTTYKETYQRDNIVAAIGVDIKL